MQTPFPGSPQYVQMPPMPPPVAERPRYSRFSALVLSFFSADLYRDVGRRWGGIALGYLVLLLAITTLAEAIKIQFGFAKFASKEAPAALQGFPGITIHQGVVSIDRPEPYLWRDPDSKEVLLYVDTSGAFDLPEGKNAKAKLGRSEVVVQQSEFESRTYDLSQVQSFSLDKTRLQGWINAAVPWIGMGFFAFVVIFALIGHLIQALIYGLFGLIFAAIFGTQIGYGGLLRLAIVALTPALILDTALTLAGVNVPHSGWIYFGLEMAYLAFAVKANAGLVATPPGFPMYPQQPQIPPPAAGF